MTKQQTIKEIKLLLDREDYEEAITCLENSIEEAPDELTYYWYLGLAYLIQENEEEAQNIWLSVFLEGSLEEIEQWTIELIKFLETKVEENLSEKKLGNAKIIYETIFVINPDYANSKLLNSLVESLSYFALELISENEREEAIEVYINILNLDSNYEKAWYSLSLCYYCLEQYDKAEESILRAISINSKSAQNKHGLGLILEKEKRYDEAVNAYKKAIENDVNFLDSYKCLGNLYSELEEIEKANEIYQRAISIFPVDSFFLKKLGETYQLLGEELKANYYLGYSYYFSGGTGSFFKALGYFQDYYNQIISSNIIIDDFKFYSSMCNCYAMCNQIDSAIALLEKALILFPERKLEIKRLNQGLLPILYTSQEDIDYYRQRFCRLLIELIEETNPDTPIKKQDTIASISVKSNFYLGYQGRNDLDVLKIYGNYVHGIMQQARPQWCKPIKAKPLLEGRKIRLGFISQRFQGLGRLYLEWIKSLNKHKFEIFIYRISDIKKDSLIGLENDFQNHSDKFREIFYSMDWNDICKILLDDELDVLIFPDFGIDAIFNLLAYLRLAPIQCTTWGHPITSGSPTIDYFLSSDLMEPSDGEKHYSETLIRLPNLGFSLPIVELPKLDVNRSYFQLNENKIIYLCSQSLFKYLPQHDYVFPSIASQNLGFQFIFVDPSHGEVITNIFKQRLNKIFNQYNLDYRKYCIFLPRLSNSDFLKLNQLADIFLDCLSWSGGMTTHQAITCGLPVVTCPGKMMRARHSYGILQMLGVTETIAKNEAEYIEIAVRLGLDREWRQTIRDKVIANKERIFEDKECIVALEAFFQEVVQKH